MSLSRRRFLQSAVAFSLAPLARAADDLDYAPSIGPFPDARFVQESVQVDAEAKTTTFSKPLKRLAFGSCNFQRKSQKHFETIADQKPDAWLWLGDIVYADHFTETMRRHEYSLVKRTSGYSRLRKDAVVLGVWDDHDYSSNGAGIDAPHKRENQKLLLDFLDEEEMSPRRAQEGVHWVYRFGPPENQLRIILLDLRYFREKRGGNAKLLGDAQWAWLEQEITTGSKAALTIVASSSQFLSTDTRKDRWARYPSERERLLALLGGLPEKAIVLSGDVHFGEFSRLGKVDEFTASGLTHAGSSGRIFPNPIRLGTPVIENHFGWIEWEESVDGRPPVVKYQLRATQGGRVLQEWGNEPEKTEPPQRVAP